MLMLKISNLHLRPSIPPTPLIGVELLGAESLQSPTLTGKN